MTGETVAAHMLGLINMVGHGAKRLEITPQTKSGNEPDALLGLFLLPSDHNKVLLAGVGRNNLNIDLEQLAQQIAELNAPQNWPSQSKDPKAEQFFKNLAADLGSPYAVISTHKEADIYRFTLYCLEELAPTEVLFEFQEQIKKEQK